MNGTERILELYCGEEGITLEKFLRRSGISRRVIIALKRVDMGMTRNGELCRSIDVLHKGDRIILRIPEISGCRPEPNGGLIIPSVYGDEDIIIYNKPAGVPVHQSHGHYGDCLANAFAASFPDVTFRAVNRLDKDTSGLCIAAKSRIGANISSGNISKVYYAVCCGRVTEPLRIDMPIGREDGSAMKRTVRDDGKQAVTNAFPVSGNEKYTLLRVIIETGRTHQIRVHMSFKGFPLAGDSLYGGDVTDIGRQALHCGEMSLIHPVSGKIIRAAAPFPEDMEDLVSGFENVRPTQ